MAFGRRTEQSRQLAFQSQRSLTRLQALVARSTNDLKYQSL